MNIWNYTRIQTPKKLRVNIKGRLPWALLPGNAARKFQEIFAGQNGGVIQNNNNNNNNNNIIQNPNLLPARVYRGTSFF